MEQIRTYILSVIAVCMLSVVCLNLAKLPRIKAVLRFVTGLLVLLVAASALLDLDEKRFGQIADALEIPLQLDQADLEQDVQSKLASHVVDTAEAYIERYASEHGATIQAKVSITQEQYPVPYSVTLIGIVTPEQKAELAQYLYHSLNIPYERQVWK